MLTSSLRNLKRLPQPMIMVSMALNTVIMAPNMVKKATERRSRLRRALKNLLETRRNPHGMLPLMKMMRVSCKTRSRPLTWMTSRQSQSRERSLNLLRMKISSSKTKITMMMKKKRKPRMSSQLRKLANHKTTWKSLRPISMTLVIWSEHLEGLPLSQSSH